MERLTRRTLLLGIGTVAGTLALAACGTTANHGGSHGAGASASSADYDQWFIDGMVPHHQAAIDMAKIARRKAEHAELKTLAEAIVADQDGEIAQMKGWRKSWYGSAEVPAGGGGHAMGGMDTDLQQLEAANPFDKAFIAAMIPHHQSAIDMAKEAQGKAKRQEIKDLAARIVTAQQAEIDRMKGWRSAWYPGE